jgi:hypothetical protein
MSISVIVIGVVVVLAATVLTLAATANKWEFLKNLVFQAVIEIERQLGSSTGQLKLAAVVSLVYPKVPAILKPFVTVANLQKIIESVLTLAQKAWNDNPALLGK